MGHHNPTPIDPTKNVIELVTLQVKRIDDLAVAETRRVDQLAVLRATYEGKLSEKEAARLNAIRDIDVKAVFTASEKQEALQRVLSNAVSTSAETLREKNEAAAAVLANALTSSAETLRALVSSTAQTAAENQKQFAEGITRRLETLEVARFEIEGRTHGTLDAEKLARVKRHDVFGWVIGLLMAAITLASIIMTHLK